MGCPLVIYNSSAFALPISYLLCAFLTFFITIEVSRGVPQEAVLGPLIIYIYIYIYIGWVAQSV